MNASVRPAERDSRCRVIVLTFMCVVVRAWRDAWQGTEGATNPATRPLVKSLMMVLSFLMGRRRRKKSRS